MALEDFLGDEPMAIEEFVEMDYSIVKDPRGRGKENREQKVQYWDEEECQEFIDYKLPLARHNMETEQYADARRDYSSLIRIARHMDRKGYAHDLDIEAMKAECRKTAGRRNRS